MVEAELQGANLTRTSLKGCDLTRVNYNSNTIWDSGFNPKLAGALFITSTSNRRKFVYNICKLITWVFTVISAFVGYNSTVGGNSPMPSIIAGIVGWVVGYWVFTFITVGLGRIILSDWDSIDPNDG